VILAGCGALGAVDASPAGGTGGGGATSTTTGAGVGGSVHWCDSGTQQLSLSGTVTAAAKSGFSLETCPPGTACDPGTVNVDVHGPGLARQRTRGWSPIRLTDKPAVVSSGLWP